MTYMLSVDTLNYIMVFMALMFACCIACEWLKDDMKTLYRVIILITNAALGLVSGWELFTNNVVFAGGMTMQFEPLGFILSTFGALNGLLLFIVIILPIIRPFGGQGSDFPSPAKQIKKPREPGMI
jgi:hypothetical protein